jgi:hypothetical protein
MVHNLVRYTCLVMILCLAPRCFSQRVDASTIEGKVLVGYQGWFRCPGDGSPENEWARWFRQGSTTADVANPATRRWVVDIFPDVSDMDPHSLCAIPNLRIHGQQAYVFSSFPKATTDTHFRWMRQYGIDGALMQRFVGDIQVYREENDTVLRHAVASAEENGRVIAVEYDISGSKKPEVLFERMKADWLYLTNDLKITRSPAYLKENGKPVVSIWGLGVANRLEDTSIGTEMVRWFKTEGHATVMGGVPSSWRSPSIVDAQTDPAWSEVYKQLDIIQPWSVARYKDAESAAAYTTTNLEPDIALTRQRHQEYLPVIFPGFSWSNLFPKDHFNAIPRRGGTLLWREAMEAKTAGSTMVKIAMFDEVNEGTAILKAAPSRNDTPSEARFVTMDADGIPLPSDWYLRVAGAIAQVYHGAAPVSRTMPPALLKYFDR